MEVEEEVNKLLEASKQSMQFEPLKFLPHQCLLLYVYITTRPCCTMIITAGGR